jgi:peroxiredoxin
MRLIMVKRPQLLIFIALLTLSANLIYNAGLSIAEPLPAITLKIPESEIYREYLGIAGTPGEKFNLADVKANILVIELFSMYCPYCQAEAPRINEFHVLARQMEKEGVSIKMVGLGASNTQFEVDYFRDTYGIQFPLFPDKNLAMYKKLGGDGTPGFIGCLVKKDASPDIILKESGGFETAEGFLALVLQRAGYR